MDLALDAFDLDRDEIERRFSWARERAQPAWLWPDIDPEKWREALVRIEAAIRPILAGREADKPLDGDPRAIGLAGYTSGTGPLLGHWLGTGLLTASPAISDLLTLQLRHNRIRMARLAEEAERAVSLLADVGLAPTILKGMHTAFDYFPDPATRPCSDIDILVAEGDTARAEAALARAGYRPEPPSPPMRARAWHAPSAPTHVKSLTFVHVDDPWSLDVHGVLDQYFSVVNVARLQSLAATSESRPWPVSPRALVLGQPLLTLQLATHASHDLNSLTLLRLVELIWVVRRDIAAGRLSWQEAAGAGRRIDVLGFIYPALKFAESLCPGTVPDGVLRECEESCPMSVRRILRGLTPATAHRVERWNWREQYMWSLTWKKRLRQTVYYLAPRDDRHTLLQLLAFYGWRARRGVKAVIGW